MNRIPNSRDIQNLLNATSAYEISLALENREAGEISFSLEQKLEILRTIAPIDAKKNNALEEYVLRLMYYDLKNDKEFNMFNIFVSKIIQKNDGKVIDCDAFKEWINYHMVSFPPTFDLDVSSREKLYERVANYILATVSTKYKRWVYDDIKARAPYMYMTFTEFKDGYADQLNQIFENYITIDSRGIDFSFVDPTLNFLDQNAIHKYISENGLFL